MKSIAHAGRRWTVAAVAALGALTLAIGAGATATATSSGQSTSTPVPSTFPDGMLMSYVVNARIANPGQVRLVEKAVATAGGVVV